MGEQVRASFPGDSAVSVTDLEHGFAICAGDVPQLCDVEKASDDRDVWAYRVARVLRPARVPAIGGPNGPVLKAAFANEWLNAFDVASEPLSATS